MGYIKLMGKVPSFLALLLSKEYFTVTIAQIYIEFAYKYGKIIRNNTYKTLKKGIKKATTNNVIA